MYPSFISWLAKIVDYLKELPPVQSTGIDYATLGYKKRADNNFFLAQYIKLHHFGDWSVKDWIVKEAARYLLNGVSPQTIDELIVQSQHF